MTLLKHSAEAPLWSTVVRNMVQAFVFIVGAVLGYLTAAVSSSFHAADNPILRYLLIYTPLALALAAPVCWFFAVVGKGHDRWTLGYVLAWVAFIGANYLGVFINKLI